MDNTPFRCGRDPAVQSVASASKELASELVPEHAAKKEVSTIRAYPKFFTAEEEVTYFEEAQRHARLAKRGGTAEERWEFLVELRNSAIASSEFALANERSVEVAESVVRAIADQNAYQAKWKRGTFGGLVPESLRADLSVEPSLLATGGGARRGMQQSSSLSLSVRNKNGVQGATVSFFDGVVTVKIEFFEKPVVAAISKAMQDGRNNGVHDIRTILEILRPQLPARQRSFHSFVDNLLIKPGKQSLSDAAGATANV